MLDQSYRLFACKYLHAQLEKLQEELAGTCIADDIECVHQSRVTSRRMRAGLEFFDNCFPTLKTNNWRNQIKAVTKKLGTARDRDVQIEFVKGFLCKLDKSQQKYKRGVNRLILRLKQDRRKIQPKIIKEINSFNSSGVIADMYSEIEKVLSVSKDKDISVRSEFVFQKCNESIKEQLDKLLSRQDSLVNPSDKNGHHQMRISAKRLRYTLEICDIAFQGELEETIMTVKNTQTYLGDIHDCDIWGEYLNQFNIDEKRRMIEYLGHGRHFTLIQKGIDYFNSECTKRRDMLFREFVGYWKGISQKGLWGKMLSIIDTPVEVNQEPSNNNQQPELYKLL